MKSKITINKFISIVPKLLDKGESWTHISRYIGCTPSACQQRYKRIFGEIPKRKKEIYKIWEICPEYQKICESFADNKYHDSKYRDRVLDFCLDYCLNLNKSAKKFLESCKSKNEGALYHLISRRLQYFWRKPENYLSLQIDQNTGKWFVAGANPDEFFKKVF